jgi:hypothetical protein
MHIKMNFVIRDVPEQPSLLEWYDVSIGNTDVSIDRHE